MKGYINDPYFIKKRETAAVFLKKAGLPETFYKTLCFKVTFMHINT